MSTRHRFVSGKAGPADPTLVGGPQWDADHAVDGVYDVLDAAYGVEVGGTVDGADAIQEAIDDCGAAGGGIVQLPHGVVKVTKGLVISTPDTHLRGHGLGTVLDYYAADASVAAVQVVPPGGTTYCSRNRLENFAVRAAAAAAYDRIGVQVAAGFMTRLRYLSATGFTTGTGFNVTGGVAGSSIKVQLVQPLTSACLTGLNLNTVGAPDYHRATEVEVLGGQFIWQDTDDDFVGVVMNEASGIHLYGVGVNGVYETPTTAVGVLMRSPDHHSDGITLLGLQIEDVHDGIDIGENFLNIAVYNPAFDNITGERFLCLSPCVSDMNGHRAYGGAIIFGANDATPSVFYGTLFGTANTNPTTITNLDDGLQGQQAWVLFLDDQTTVDFTAGSYMKGHGGVDWSPSNGDFMKCIKAGDNWLCVCEEAS